MHKFSQRAVVFLSTTIFVGSIPIGGSPLAIQPMRHVERAGNAREKTLFAFPSGPGGETPLGPVTAGENGALLGLTQNGGSPGDSGIVYRLEPTAGGYVEDVLYSFPEGDTLSGWDLGVTVHDGHVYGVVPNGGGHKNGSSGTIYRIGFAMGSPHEQTIFRFDQTDGFQPDGALLVGADGTLYGNTGGGGGTGVDGTVFALTGGPTGTLTTLHAFGPEPDGSRPQGPLVADSAGGLYGTTYVGGTGNDGTVFKLTPNGSGYSETILHNFQGGTDGQYPTGGLLMDSSGDLYGMTAGKLSECSSGTASCGGSVYELTPTSHGYVKSTLWVFEGRPGRIDGKDPIGGLVGDAAGTLYGAVQEDGGLNGKGMVFALTPSGSIYTETILHKFTGPDGSDPTGTPLLTQSGHLIGATSSGGPPCASSPGGEGCGVIYEIAP